ncbi:MAG: signal recognition particle-docking protein FtsY [candidate division WOR-3 bacterium]|nr:MAG: signal recognition particle-docking protein FtsY [candidate division WOR-3 bacterium]
MLEPIRKAFGKAAALFSQIKNAPLDDIEEILLRADVGTRFTRILLESLKGKRNDIVETLKGDMVRLLTVPKPVETGIKPTVVMVSGVNGSGKTTTIAKLAHRCSEHESVLLAGADTYRDAANEQLAVWAQRARVEMIMSQRGQDAASVVFDALTRARSQGIGTVFVDTAGRLHTRRDLMDELVKIERIIKKFKPDGPDLNLLTIDARLGQNSITQARVFSEAINLNGLILTKFDGTAKGGALIPICNELKLPVLYLGVGEGLDDIVVFEPEKFVSMLFS